MCEAKLDYKAIFPEEAQPFHPPLLPVLKLGGMIYESPSAHNSSQNCRLSMYVDVPVRFDNGSCRKYNEPFLR